MTGGARALFVVEGTFLDEHVGVLRVLAHYHARLTGLGTEVDFAVPLDGRLALLDEASTRTVVQRLGSPRSGTATPSWTSSGGWAAEPEPSGPHPTAGTALALGGTCRASDYDVSLLTNPWLCDRPMPDERFTHGVVYDLVPNLLEVHALDLGAAYHGHAFAGAHHRGYAYFVDHVDEVLCISDSTADDFLSFYGPSSPPVRVDVPFEPDDAQPVNDRWSSAPASRARLLLVNALDLRKNILGMEAALLEAAEGRAVHLDVVGRERMPLDEAMAVLDGLGAAGMTVDWYRGASDARLGELYAGSDGLLFTSLYEGLGLPVLEAQGCGLPTLVSDTSSCREISLNPSLRVDPLDVAANAEAIVRIVERDDRILTGAGLRAAQRAWLATRNRWPACG